MGQTKKFNGIFLLLLLFLSSCQQKKNDPYQDAIYRYFREIHQKDYQSLNKEEELVIIPLSSCNPCIKDVMTFLIDTNKDGIILVITGESLEEDISDMLTVLKGMYAFMLDSDNYLKRYRMNISGPSHLFISNTTVIKTKLDKENIPKVIL